MALLVHGTGVTIGTTGLILVGPSGAGKSSMALRLIFEARRQGHLGALIGDDQLFVEAVNGRVVATAPASIKGMIEIHGSGIGRIETVECAVLSFALQPVVADASTRIPEENQCWRAGDDISLPLHSIDRAASDPFSRLCAILPGFPVSGVFQL